LSSPSGVRKNSVGSVPSEPAVQNLNCADRSHQQNIYHRRAPTPEERRFQQFFKTKSTRNHVNQPTKRVAVNDTAKSIKRRSNLLVSKKSDWKRSLTGLVNRQRSFAAVDSRCGVQLLSATSRNSSSESSS